MSATLENWKKLLAFHIKNGTGRIWWLYELEIEGKTLSKEAQEKILMEIRRKNEGKEWIAEDLVFAIQKKLNQRRQFSPSTLSGWRNARHFPKGKHRDALINVFWPKRLPTNDVKEFTKALSAADSEESFSKKFVRDEPVTRSMIQQIDRSTDVRLEVVANQIVSITKSIIEQYESQDGENIEKLLTAHDSVIGSVSQEEAYKVSRIIINEEPDTKFNIRMLSGVSGVGKSVVLRKITKTLVEDFQHPENELISSIIRYRLPIVINLGRVLFNYPENPIGHNIIYWWLVDINRERIKLYRGDKPEDKITVDCIKKLRSEYVIVAILDSADELLENNPNIRESDLANWLKSQGALEDGEPIFDRIIVARRSSEGRPPYLAGQIGTISALAACRI